MNYLLGKKTSFRQIYLLFVFLFLLFFFSFRLTRIPPGINIDESSIGYNASLISKTLHDENNRFLPIFILTLEGKDWKQPVRIYFTALVFKLFGTSYFNLRFVSVIFAVSSCIIFFKLLRLFFSEGLSLIGLLLFASSPSLLLQSHLALENIDLLPFILLWLYFLFSFSLKQNGWKLFLSGIFLGVSFYAYKGARAYVPVYIFSSILYLAYLVFINKKGKLIHIFCFALGLTPFLLPIKWLQIHYAGAIFDPVNVVAPSFYGAANKYLSSFDFSFLFLKGDKMLIHSTGHHGIFLIPTLILFFLGFLQMVKEKKSFFYLIFFSLIFTPILLTSVESIYRASRLMVFIPLMTIIFTLGFKSILEIERKPFRIICLLFIVISLSANYFDFVNYYWNKYPKTISQEFSPNLDIATSELKKLTVETGKSPYFETNTYITHKTGIQFFKEVYFPYQEIKMWTREEDPFPENSFVLSNISGSGEIVNYRSIPSLEAGQRTIYILEKLN